MTRIGTIKIKTANSGKVSVPVFATGSSGSSVYEFVKIRTKGEMGYIPVVNPKDASYSYLKVKTKTQGVVALHDSDIVSLVIEDFEGRNISEYTGDTSQASIQSSLVYNGNYALRFTDNGSGANHLISNSEFQISQGESFEWRQHTSNMKSGTGLVIGVQDETGINNIDGYLFGIEDAGGINDMNIGKYENGGFSWLETTGPNIPSNEWLHNLVSWGTDGSISWELRDSNSNTINSFTVNDETYTSGGIGWAASYNNSGSPSVTFDFLKNQ